MHTQNIEAVRQEIIRLTELQHDFLQDMLEAEGVLSADGGEGEKVLRETLKKTS